MEQGMDAHTGSEVLYPILLLPKQCTNLLVNCEVSENVFIDVTITSPDTEGNNACIYTGFCNIKMIDCYDVNIQARKLSADITNLDEPLPVIIADHSSYNENQVWIDPSRSPYVYNNYGVDSQESYVCHQSQTSIMVEQCNTYITKNVYNYKEAVHYSAHEEQETRKPRKQAMDQQTLDGNTYVDDEFECGVFLSHLPEEIMNEKEIKAREEQKYIGLQSENSALKQLMSPGIQSMSKQRKTILFLGPDSHSGQTIQQIGYYDPTMECSGGPAVDNEVVIEDSDSPHQKRYQCAKCHQIFEQIASFRDHMVHHTITAATRRQTRFGPAEPELQFICEDCGKVLRTKEKFDRHCKGHGDPDLECSLCNKVFATKFTLRAHRKLHSRQYACALCPRTYATAEQLHAHSAKAHCQFHCASCDFVAPKHSELVAHQVVHETVHPHDSSETEFAESFFGDVITEDDVIASPPDWRIEDSDDKPLAVSAAENRKKFEEIQKADSVIAKVMSNKMFLTAKYKRHRRHRKVCDVCFKSFDRVSDLKRHLIEHIVRSTLDKTPVSKSGTLMLQCEVCQNESFTQIDRYKAHLREHAKLTLYKCTFCNKSFSDSSNFSKHKKIHGTQYFQCDLCQRKFNSKKMITRHMDYHKENKPMNCAHCGKEFHFESMLNKHIKSAHTRVLTSKARCMFCHEYFPGNKDKWDHEWDIHKVRKMVADCLICGAKFRKYAELKRHCNNIHNVEIPRAKKMLKDETKWY